MHISRSPCRRGEQLVIVFGNIVLMLTSSRIVFHSCFKMGWTYLLLVSLLLRIAVAQQSNPFTAKVPDLTFSEPFTIYWEPTTEGTVTVTIVTLDNNNFDVGDFAIIGSTLCLPYAHV